LIGYDLFENHVVQTGPCRGKQLMTSFKILTILPFVNVNVFAFDL